MPNVAVHEVKMREDRTLFAFTHGRGMFALPLKAAKVGVRVVGRDGRLQAKIYPNPSSDGLRVSSAMNLLGARYSVMDLGGREVSSGILGDGGLVDTRALKNGSYFLRVDVANRALTSKFIVQH